ncbi:MAG: PQQ-dependent sugar dehydrogenase [Pirellulales bacterium]
MQLFRISVLLLSFLGGLILGTEITLGPNARAMVDEPPHVARVPWTTSRITGSPEPPPPFVAARRFPEVKLKEPVFIVWSSALKRYLVGERRGVMHSLANQPNAKAELAFDFTKELQRASWPKDAGRVEALYAVAFHPRFAENRWCYVCYTLAHQDSKKPNLAEGSRISRFRMLDTDPPRLDPASEEVVLTWEQGGHNGCDLQFGPDGFLYISTGDARPPNPPDQLHTGQDITDLLSSILRIDVDRRDPGKNYAVPVDNPFLGLVLEGKPARAEVWAYGFRNPWRMSFDRQTGELWVGDVGWELWELVHKVERGGNYGWSAVEGRQPIHTADGTGPSPIRPPLLELPHTIAASITGGFVYRGKRFPELVGAYVFGDWEFRRLWAARFKDGRLESLTEITRPSVRVVSFGEDEDGELLYLDYDTGFIHTLERNDGQGQNRNFPQTLSATGLFDSVTDQRPAAGVIPYEINSPQWHDGAQARRWLALPGNSGISVYPGDGKPMPSQVYWHSFRLHFPQDAVLVKTLSCETMVGDRSEQRPVETQVLHFDGADWRAYTYAWRDDLSDADLVPAGGGEKMLKVADARRQSGTREHLWRFNDRTQCLQCHSQWPQYAIGFHLSQLSRDVATGGGERENQLITLGKSGHLVRRAMDDSVQPPFDAKLAAGEERLPDPNDQAVSLDSRARSYLHANCSHCHRFNGGGIVGLDLLYKKSLPETHLLDSPIRGDFGLKEARIVTPGAPSRSTLYFRMAKFGRDRMPHVGSEMPDEQGLSLMRQWIAALPTEGGLKAEANQDPDATTIDPVRWSNEIPLALHWARRWGRGELSKGEQERVELAAKQLEPGTLRDLFEGYFPEDAGARKLGPRPRVESIVSLTGDVGRGATLFRDAALKCVTCHKVGDLGASLGPELTRIAQKRNREELLDSLLQPSRTVEPAFAAYQVLLHDGRQLAGLLVKRTAEEFVLRDVQNKEIVLKASEVDRLSVARASLMPEGLLAGLTAQQAADLLAFLETLK